MSVIDIANGNELDRIVVGYGGRAVALSADEKYAFISVEPDNEIAVIDLSQNKVVHRVTVGASPRGIALDKDTNELYVADFDRSHSPVGSRNALSIVDVSDPLSAKYVGEIKVGLGPCSVSILNR
jgi:YVTN family beta-propeller protein